jgi:hypothetical protein
MSEQPDGRPVDEQPPAADTVVPPDDDGDPARDDATLGIDNTDTALAPEDMSSEVE